MADRPFLDFAAIKAAVSIEQCVQWLGITLKGTGAQLRGDCPTCGGSRTLAVNTAKGSFFCFAKSQGGDCVGLVAHVHDIGQRDAAQEIAEHFRIGLPEKAQKPERRAEASENGMEPLSHLEFDHPALDALGFDAETAEALGIGFTSRGLMKGLVAVPIRLECGTLVGYLGIQEAKLPPSWKLPEQKVVAFKKPA